MEDTFRLPNEGEPVVNFLLEELHEVPLEILVEVRLILPGEELPLEGEHTLELSRDKELDIELSSDEELAENSLTVDGFEKAVSQSPRLERECILNPWNLEPATFFLLVPPVFL